MAAELEFTGGWQWQWRELRDQVGGFEFELGRGRSEVIAAFYRVLEVR
jgi:hypothetical protein